MNPQTSCIPEPPRVIFYHKNDISALLLFLQHPGDSVCAPGPLPKLSAVLDETESSPESVLRHHPSAVVRGVSEDLGLPPGMLKADGAFRHQVDTPAGLVDIYLARFDTPEAPHELVGRRGARFLPLTALRGRPPAEMELLLRAYRATMEG